MTKNFITVLLMFTICNALGQANNKISASFQYLLTHPLNQETEATYPALFKISPVNGYSPKTNSYTDGYMCFIYTTNSTLLKERGVVINAVLPTFVSAWITLDQITELAGLNEVKYIDASQVIMPSNDINIATSGAALLHSGNLNNIAYNGNGVIVGVFDTGIDWDHLDFRNPNDTTKSRILRIWDQTITPITGETSPTGFNYGVEYSQAQINNELDGTPTGFVRERDTNGHGTHVTGTAAGNGASLASKKYMGIAPNADIVFVKGGNNSFTYPNQVNGMEYFKNIANTFGKPLVVNMSLGGQFGAHDGTAPPEIAVDNFSNSAAGRVAVISAGNDNGSALHKQINIAANGTSSVTINVPSASGTSAVDLFQFALYVNDTSQVIATLTDPNGGVFTLNPNQSVVQNAMNNTATIYFDNKIDVECGDRLVNLYIARKSTAVNPFGNWVLTITNISNNNLTLDGWLNFRGANYAGTSVGGDSKYLTNTPGNATTAISVASFMGKLDWYSVSTTAPGGYAYSNAQQDNISNFSSNGPRRDNVLKPNITANGQGVASCTSSDAGISLSSNSVVVANKYHILAGTSMSTPEVAGCVALLLQVKNNATYTEIKNAISNTATKDNFTSNTDNEIWGSGKIDVFRAASSLATCTIFKRITYSYDSSTTSANNPSFSLGAAKAATRFTPTISGKLGGVYFKTGTSIPATSFTIEVRTNSAGNPATLLGSMNIAASSIAKFSWNYYDVSALNIAVTDGTDYFIVLVPEASDSWNVGYENLTNSGRSFYSNGSSWTAYNDFRIRSVVYDNNVPSTSSTTNSSICSSALPFSWNGLTFTGAGSQTVNLRNVASCDSAATLNLTIKQASSSTSSVAIFASQFPFSWNGLIFTNAGSQTAYLTNAVGCDSAATLNLTINPNVVLAISGLNQVCVSSTITLSTNISGGVWSSVAGRASVNNAGLVTGTSAGTATIKYILGSRSVTQIITVNAIPAVPTIAYGTGNTVNPQTTGGFCTNRTFNIVGIPSGGIWSKTGVIGITNPACVVTTGSVAGFATVTYRFTDANGCVNGRTMNTNVVACASRGANSQSTIDDRLSNMDNGQWTLFPNPARTFINLNVETLIGRGSIVVTDLCGKTVKTQPLSMGINTVDIANLSKGIYFISTITNKKKITKKLIIE